MLSLLRHTICYEIGEYLMYNCISIDTDIGQYRYTIYTTNNLSFL